jgi:uncharacterized protein (TIGR03083 family)
MDIEAHVAVLDQAGKALAAAADEAGPDAEVPTCPGWRVRDLLHHLGGVHRWAASYVATGRDRPWSDEEVKPFFPTVEDATLVDWYRAGHREVVAALRGGSTDTPSWSFLPAPSPLAFWARRQAHETAIHRADAESAVGSTPRWDPAFAADGVDELLCGFYGRRGGRLRADPPFSLCVVADDVDTAWSIRVLPDRRVVAHGREDADLTVTGAANDLYLMLWNRGGTERLTLDGDPRPLETWRALARVSWA